MIQGLNESQKVKASSGVESRFFALYRTALKMKPDYIHMDWLEKYYIRRAAWMTTIFWPLFLLDLFLVKKLTKTKLVWTMHNLKPHNLAHQKIAEKAYKVFGRKCTWIRVFDENTASKASELYGLNVNMFKVIPEGSYVDYYNKSTDNNLIEPSGDKIHFLYLGHLKRYKGVLESIDDIQRLNLPDWKYTIIGKCSDRSYFEELVQKASSDNRIVIQNEYIEDDQLAKYFAQCDYVYLPFKDIENSGSLILAMGFQKAIIAPNIGVISTRLSSQPELLYNESVLEIKNKLLNLTRGEIKKIGRANFEALKKYQWTDFASVFI